MSLKTHGKDFLSNLLVGRLCIGSNAPVKGLPRWATHEVMNGGFATGVAAAALKHGQRDNRSYLTADFAELLGLLESRRYRLDCVEEGALLVVAWLAKHGNADAANQVLAEIAPYIDTLRFYPANVDAPGDPPRRAVSDDRDVHVLTVGDVVSKIGEIAARPAKDRLLMRNEALTVWVPLHDQFMDLLRETADGAGFPLQKYPAGWRCRAASVLASYDHARGRHALVQTPGGQSMQRMVDAVRSVLLCPAGSERQLDLGRSVMQIQKSLAKCRKDVRAGQRRIIELFEKDVQLRPKICRDLQEKLLALPQQDGGLPESEHDVLAASLDKGASDAPRTASRLGRLLALCLDAPLEQHIDRGLVRSAEHAAALVPQMTSSVETDDIDHEQDPDLKHLMVQLLRAFKKRRSLLLLNLERQVRQSDVPWIRLAFQAHRERADKGADAGASLSHKKAVVGMLLRAVLKKWPHVPLPNKLLSELRMLCHPHVPITEELAADIYQGRYAPKYETARKAVQSALGDTLYGAYYGLKQTDVSTLPLEKWCSMRAAANRATTYCTSGVAAKGRQIEWQEIATTRSLLPLLAWLLPSGAIDSADLLQMARDSYRWLCSVMGKDGSRSLHDVKNQAYGFRQMVVYLALCGADHRAAFFADVDASITPEAAAGPSPALAKHMRTLRRAYDEGAAYVYVPGSAFTGWM